MLLTEFRVNLKRSLEEKKFLEITITYMWLLVTVGFLSDLLPPFFARNPDGLSVLMGSVDELCFCELWNSCKTQEWVVLCRCGACMLIRKPQKSQSASDFCKVRCSKTIRCCRNTVRVSQTSASRATPSRVFFTDRKETTHVYEFYSLWPFNLSQIVLKQLLQLLNVYHEVQVLLELCPISIGIVK